MEPVPALNVWLTHPSCVGRAYPDTSIKCLGRHARKIAQQALRAVGVMALRRTRTFQAAVIVACTALFVIGGHLGALAVIEAQRTNRMQELADVALRRVESSVDVGVAALEATGGGQVLACDPAALQAVRLRVYERSSIKDIRVANHDGSIVCSAYAETLEFDDSLVLRPDMKIAADGVSRLFRVDQFNGSALGVMRDVTADRSLIGIVSINAFLFDIMPGELRDYSDFRLTLAGDENVGSFASEPNFHSDKAAAFGESSRRYPLTMTIAVDRERLAHWNAGLYWPAMVLASALGLAFGVLLARALSKPLDPASEIDRGLAAREFHPYYQPLFDLESRAIIGCEVLARWVRSDGSVTPPMSFIPLAESTGRIEAITWQILRQALDELQPLLKRDKRFKLSFNVVPKHLVSDGFVDRLRKVVLEARVSARQIVIEVTERDALPDLARAAEIVATLRGYGFRVAIDDVGVGHSGLSQIKGLGAHAIKIDKFFVDTITRDGTAVAVVAMLVKLAAELGMNVVAEGIEDAAQIDALRACGVREGQGYIVSPPLPFARFDALMIASDAGLAAKTSPGLEQVA